MQRTTTSPRRLSAKIVPDAVGDLGLGGQIDWSKVSAYYYKVGKFTVKLSEAVDIGETAITVDALPYPLKKGVTLDFGRQASVLVTLSATEAIGQTVLSVVALPGALPAGAILNFGVNKQAVLTAAAAAAATTITVEALDTEITSGDTATYQGGARNLEVTEDAAAGATAIVVEAPQFALANDEEAIATQAGQFGRKIPAFTVMARTSGGDLIPRRDATSETAVEVLQSDADEESMSDAKTGYGTWKGGGFYENLLPDAGTEGAAAGDLPSAWATELGIRFWYSDWVDSRAA